jgi:hypothetical protein
MGTFGAKLLGPLRALHATVIPLNNKIHADP